jgi:hypothetical protein
MDRKAIEEAIEVLEDASAEMLMETGDENYYGEAIAVLRQALEIETEPVAWASSLDFDDDDQEIIPAKDKGKLGTSNCDIPLYTAPKQWVGLTGEEIEDLSYLSQKIDESNAPWFDRCGFARVIEAKLKEKNA